MISNAAADGNGAAAAGGYDEHDDYASAYPHMRLLLLLYVYLHNI